MSVDRPPRATYTPAEAAASYVEQLSNVELIAIAHRRGLVLVEREDTDYQPRHAKSS